MSIGNRICPALTSEILMGICKESNGAPDAVYLPIYLPCDTWRTELGWLGTGH